MSDRAESGWHAAARFVAGQPGGSDRLLGLHPVRSDGTCAGCSARPVRWPCTAASIALMARGVRPLPVDGTRPRRVLVPAQRRVRRDPGVRASLTTA
jgi:hypothetical protein